MVRVESGSLSLDETHGHLLRISKNPPFGCVAAENLAAENLAAENLLSYHCTAKDLCDALAKNVQPAVS